MLKWCCLILGSLKLRKINAKSRPVIAHGRHFFFYRRPLLLLPTIQFDIRLKHSLPCPVHAKNFFDDFKRFWERLSEFWNFMQMRAGGGGVKWRQPVLTAGLIYWLTLGKWKRLTWKANSKWPPVWHERSRRARYFQRLIRFFKKYVNFEGKRNSTISMTYHNKNHLMNFDI